MSLFLRCRIFGVSLAVDFGSDEIVGYWRCDVSLIHEIFLHHGSSSHVHKPVQSGEVESDFDGYGGVLGRLRSRKFGIRDLLKVGKQLVWICHGFEIKDVSFIFQVSENLSVALVLGPEFNSFHNCIEFDAFGEEGEHKELGKLFVQCFLDRLTVWAVYGLTNVVCLLQQERTLL